MKTKTARIHALDALRAHMMLLGIVFHSAIAYCVCDRGISWPLPLQDADSTTRVMDIVSIYIHLFRMPVFFMVAGFFGAFLFYERSVVSVVKNRTRRIVLPFIVFVMFLWPFMGSSYMFAHMAFTGIIMPEAAEPFRLSNFIPQNLFHLWFLYYLIMITVIAVCIALVLRRMPRLTRSVSSFLAPVLAHTFLRVGGLSALIFLIFLIIDKEWVETSFSFVPNGGILLFYTTIYLFGWYLYKAKDKISTFSKHAWVLLPASFTIFVFALLFHDSIPSMGRMASNALVGSLSLFSITGLYFRYFNRSSPTMRYISDASYWVYLIHMPFTLLGQGLLADYPLPPLLKFLIIALVTTGICFVTYHYFVRSTFIGKFLNGRTYLRALPQKIGGTAFSKSQTIE